MSERLLPKSGVVNLLLMDIAQRIQLPPSAYRIAIERYTTLQTHLQRKNSPLQGRIVRLYPQGSMGIGAVISSKFDNDEFDVDIVVELLFSPISAPATVLDTLYQAIAGEPGSFYHSKTERQSRCVTVKYDTMHVDFTPAVRLTDPRERVSHIFHAHEDDPPEKHYHVVANPWGFCQWFEDQMPEAHSFVEAVLRKQADPLPDQEELNEKSLPLVALQLLKRWRNKIYDQRDGRKPPSVMLSYFVAVHGGRRPDLLSELLFQAQSLLDVLRAHNSQGKLLDVRNPACEEDRFTDRWPESLSHQLVFTLDVQQLVGQLTVLATGGTLTQYQEVLSDLFGERPTKVVFEEFAKRYTGSSFAHNLHHQPVSGALALRESGLSRSVPIAGTAIVTPRKTNFGSDGGS